MEHVPLSRRSGPFAVLAVVGLVVGATALHAAGRYVQFSNTDVANHEAAVGAGMFAFVAVAAIAVVLAWWRL